MTVLLSKLYSIRSWCFRVPVSLQWTKFCEAALGDDFFNAAADVKVTFIIGSHKKNPHTRLGASCIHIHKMKSVQQTSPELLFEILNHKRVCIRDALVFNATRCVFTSFLSLFKWIFYDKYLESDCKFKIEKFEDAFGYLNLLLVKTWPLQYLEL